LLQWGLRCDHNFATAHFANTSHTTHNFAINHANSRARIPPRLSLECRPYQPLQSGTAMGLTGSRNEGSKSIARPSSVSPSVVLKQKEALFISRFIFCRRLPHINPPLLEVLCSAPLCHRRRSCLCLPSLKKMRLLI